MGKTIPESDGKFDVFQGALVKAADAKKTQWGLPATWITNTVLPAQAVWRGKYDAWIPENTRTSQITFEKNEARKHYETLLRMLVEIMQGTPLMTDDDRKSVNIYIEPHSNKPLPPTDEVIGFNVQLFPMHRVVINCFCLSTGAKTKPHGVDAIELRWGVLDEPTEDPEDLPHVELSSRAPITLDFDEDERGGTLYFVARYVMRNKSEGRWNDVSSTLIP
jgi:hypothetical protein